VTAERLFASIRTLHYVPLDISAEYLQSAVARLEPAHPGLEIIALGQDFHDALALPAHVPASRRLFFYPDSSIGNLDPAQALSLLTRVRAECAGGGLLIGVDRVKPRHILEPAYDYALHLTAAFNLNLFRHVTALLDTD